MRKDGVWYKELVWLHSYFHGHEQWQSCWNFSLLCVSTNADACLRELRWSRHYQEDYLHQRTEHSSSDFLDFFFLMSRVSGHKKNVDMIVVLILWTHWKQPGEYILRTEVLDHWFPLPQHRNIGLELHSG